LEQAVTSKGQIELSQKDNKRTENEFRMVRKRDFPSIIRSFRCMSIELESKLVLEVLVVKNSNRKSTENSRKACSFLFAGDIGLSSQC